VSTRVDPSHAIAIVGMGCRFPKADDAEQYWNNIAAGATAFGDVPADRWNHQVFFHASQREIDKSWTAKGSFIDDVKSFAALHYGIAPRRLDVMDPQQRLLIEATRVALQDAGYEVKAFDRSRSGVFFGVSVSEFKNIAEARIMAMMLAAGEFGAAAGSKALRDALMSMVDGIVPTRAFSLAGSLTALNAAAVSQTFDLGGPSFTVDAACASASVAINDAILNLRARLIDSAIAGGCYLNLTPDNLVAFTRIGAISPSGACRPFDARADGFVQSDGVGVLFLKRLEDALADGDRIHAIIRGTGCNNDGRGEGPMTPRVEGQLAALRAAYRDAGFSPATIAYFEAHGTATAVGDPVEVEALGTLLEEAGVTKSAPAHLGSVKGNIGHAMSAAGIAGLIKVVKLLEHRVAPPQAGYEKPNPILGLDRWPVQLSNRMLPLEPREGAPLRAALSSFGFGGTNSHLVLEEAPRVASRPAASFAAASSSDRDRDRRTQDVLPEAVLITAPTVPLLREHVDAIATSLDQGTLANASLADIAYTLNARRRRERVRAVVGARTMKELADNLRVLQATLSHLGSSAKLPLAISPHLAVYEDLAGNAGVLATNAGSTDAGASAAPPRSADHPSADAAANPRPKIAFLFPGQGAQKLHLLASLRARFPRFREKLASLEAALMGVLDRPLTSYLYPDRSRVASEGTEKLEGELTATEVCQPAMAALGIAAAALLEDAGIRADVSLGHSLGEFAALANAGVLSAEDAVRFVALRGCAIRDLGLADPGAMAAVMADRETVEASIAGIDGVAVANVNHPRQVSISGTTAGVRRATEALAARGLEARSLSVSHAFHSPLLDGIRPEVDRLLDRIEVRPPRHVVASCVSGSTYGDDPAGSRGVMTGHATAPVDFVRALEIAREAGATVFLQAGAGATLASFARSTCGEWIHALTIAPLEEDGGYELIRAATTLAALGVPVDFEPLYAGEGRAVVEMPETPLERQQYWVAKPKQPKPVLDFPLPDARDGRPIVQLEPKEETMSRNASSESESKSDVREDLVRLFEKQAEILRSHAEIIAQQNRALFGGEPGARADEARAAAAGLRPEPPLISAPPVPEAPKPSPAQGEPARTPTSEPPSRAPEPGAGAAPSATPKIDPRIVRERVFEIVARISAFPKESLRGDQRLVDELGFDSLMVADLGGAIESAYPNLGGLPPSLFSMKTTLEEVADHVAKKATAERAPAGPPEKREAASRYRVQAKPRARANVAVHDPRNETWLVTEDATGLGVEIAANLEAKGARVVRIRFAANGVAAADRLSIKNVNLWPESFAEGLAGALADAGLEIDGFVHLSGRGVAHDFAKNPVLLLHPLASRIAASRFCAVTALGGRLGLERSKAAAENVLHAALLGYTKALGRERPNAVVRGLDINPETPAKVNAQWIVDEILSGDLTPECGFDGADRFIAELVPVPSASNPSREIEKSDVVLITGGLGEIGSEIALHVAARQPKGIVLVGRRALDDRAKKLLAEIQGRGTKAIYASADAASEKSLRTATAAAVEALGPVTVAIHAAGAIEDAPVAKKTNEVIARVMNGKVLGVQALMRVFPRLRDLVIFSSWAGRFGNAHQADYAAANELVDRLALTADPRVRAISIVWPPWSSTKMVASIPAVVQRAMAAEGVTFLSNAEGIAAFDEIFAAAEPGIEVVGRALPRFATRLRHEERFDLARHPYLNDHRLKDRAVVPIAAAVDLIAFTAFGGKAPAGRWALESVELVRGLYEGDSAVVHADKRAAAPGVGEAKVEVRAGDSIAYRGVVRAGAVAPPAAIDLDGDPEAPALDLDAFYRHHTFHGPMMRGIVRVERLTKNGAAGLVRTSKPRTWMPDTAREAWAIDPLVIDGSFQLAGYWSALHLERGGYPTGFDRLVVLRPFGEGSIRATLVVSGWDGETFTGSIKYEDEEGALCAVLAGLRGRFLEDREKAERGERVEKGNGNGAAPIPDEHCNIASFPEVEALDQRFQMAELIGLRNPYFHVHAGTARNTSIVDGVEMINFSSYNYLGFSGHPEVIAAAKEAIDRYGTSVSASRVASGERPIHRELEEGIAQHLGVEDSIVFVSGHATNVTTIGHLFDEHDLIVHDSLIHDSIMNGVHLSGATRRPFPHGDLDALERTLEAVRRNYRRVLICAEGIYSMDGDICDLPRLIEIKKRFKALLLIDEAHSIGVLGPAGRGLGHHFAGVDPNDVDLWMGTLSKSFASCGGYIAGSKALVRYLKYTVPGFVYSAGITPPNAAAALKSLELMSRHPEIVERLRARSKLFLELARARGIDTGLAVGAAVVPAIVGNSLDCMRLSEALAIRRINVQPIVYPAVEDDASRLRFFLSATHTEDQLRHTVDVLAEELEKVRKTSGSQAALSI
jgi:8-amino-7-oxononanoate synthase